MSDTTVSFSVLCEMLEAIMRSKKAQMKRKHIRTFLDHVYTDKEYFSAMRLLLPQLDRERRAYKLKEAQLARALTDALALSKDSHDAQRLLNWRKGGAKTGAHAGNFSLVASQVLSTRQQSTTGVLKIKDVNDLLDRLAETESREDKTKILGEFINKTNATEMKWILMIILKDLKMGISEKSLFHEFHPDAEDMFNVTCDLKLVCEKLKDKNERFKRQDIEVGKAVRPQLASRVPDVETAWKKLHGKQVLVECKFDGDRIQIHKNGKEIQYFSRNFIDHSEYEHGMSRTIIESIKVDKCILDGEMLVWDTTSQRFADFGSNQEIAKAAKEGLESNQQLCYVVFDILYAGDTSVIHQRLHERHQLLRDVVKPVKGRLEVLLPQESLSTSRSGEPCRSFIAASMHEVDKFFKDVVENRYEGIVLKDLDSKWEPSDRSGKWIKLKPDYVNTGSDLDALIIGGYYGSGRRGGGVAQFLLGLAQKPSSGGYPTRFISFCRVGTGLSDEESAVLVSKLEPYFRKSDKNAAIPSFYTVTNNSKERPDVWIDQPQKSVILEITSDVRMIKSEVFAAPYSLRFPRISRVRYDKPWHDCLDVQSFVDLVQSRSSIPGNVGYNMDSNQQKFKRPKQTSKEEKKSFSVVPLHMLMTDVSSVKRETQIFKNMMFYFVNLPPDFSLDQFHKLVVEHGGSFSMNLNDSVTHVVASDKRGIKYQAAAKHGDVIHYSWITDCCREKCSLPLRPKYYLSFSDMSKEKMKEDVDVFGDNFFWDLDVSDLRQIFENLGRSKLVSAIVDDEYKSKYSPSDTWCLFTNCSVYFHRPLHSTNADSQTISELTLKRLKIDIGMHGGLATSTIGQATHMIVYSTPEYTVPFKSILSSLSIADKKSLRKKNAYILSHLWLEDSMKEGRRLPESNYDLKASADYDIESSRDNSDSKTDSEETSLSERKIEEEDKATGRRRSQKVSAPRRNVRRAPHIKKKTAFEYPDSSGESENANKEEGIELDMPDSSTLGKVESKGKGKGKRQNKLQQSTKPVRRGKKQKVVESPIEEARECDASETSEERPTRNKGKGVVETAKEYQNEDSSVHKNARRGKKQKAVGRPVEKGRVQTSSESSEERPTLNKGKHISSESVQQKHDRANECGKSSKDVDSRNASTNDNESMLDASSGGKNYSQIPTEVLDDPLQDMIADILPNFDLRNPSLKDSPPRTYSKDLKSERTSESVEQKPENKDLKREGTSENVEQQPEKKKKVSYKDLVGRLLGD